MHSEKHRYWKGHQRDLRLQSDEPSPCSPQFSTIVLSSWMFARTECRCLTEEHKGRHGPYATPPIMGHMRPHHDCIPWFYFHPLQHLFSDLMWNLNTFYLIFPVAVPFLTGFLCMTFMYRWKEFWSDDSNYPSVHKELRQGCRKLLKREEKLLPRFLGFPLIGRMSPHLWWRIS